MMEFWDAVASLDHMHTICTSLQTVNYTTPHHSIFTDQMLFLLSSQQCHSTVKVKSHVKIQSIL